MACVYHAPAPKDHPSSKQPQKLLRTTSYEPEEMMEPTRAGEWGAFVCTCTPCSVVRTTRANMLGCDKGGGQWACDIKILAKNHRFGLKTISMWTEPKYFSSTGWLLAPNPNKLTNRLKPSTFQILIRMGENYLLTLGFIKRHQERRNNSSPQHSVGPKQ